MRTTTNNGYQKAAYKYPLSPVILAYMDVYPEKLPEYLKLVERSVSEVLGLGDANFTDRIRKRELVEARIICVFFFYPFYRTHAEIAYDLGLLRNGKYGDHSVITYYKKSFNDRFESTYKTLVNNVYEKIDDHFHIKSSKHRNINVKKYIDAKLETIMQMIGVLDKTAYEQRYYTEVMKVFNNFKTSDPMPRVVENKKFIKFR